MLSAAPVSSITIAGAQVEPGTRRRIELPVGRLPTSAQVHMRVEVLHGQEPGPRLWIAGAIHGDELNGVEIVRRVVERLDPSRLAGTLVAVPIVNVFGFLQESRYLPDRRDLNRCFPGKQRGSQASRLAHLFMKEIVEGCTHGVDLHTAATGRFNHPHLRCDFDDPDALRMARAFGTELILNSKGPTKSVRRAAARRGIPVVLYEAGEALRFGQPAVRMGVAGVLRVMGELGMYADAPSPTTEPLEAQRSAWVRARRGGVLRLEKVSGESVERGETVGLIGDALGEASVEVHAPSDGIIIGHATHPLISQGDAVMHVAQV